MDARSERRAAPAADLLAQLITELGLPRGLMTAGISRDDFATIAEASLQTPWVPKNPRRITSAKDVLQILDLAA
ncbi:iron-containing alcohol dehydrogenase [Thalassovita gelatinovora]|uniref:iron-containing alcohol dehydrogenase n=1 Tax=Thalassovita gelatinovora TaxID=53501 RepID=UPI00071CCF23|nr:iron-containing alcohol dehydrogenase [Thalassovita gelatinovora]QIZ79631.1 iron-containing alcohol dehydrogenase [Thalassovita gelatinovora]